MTQSEEYQKRARAAEAHAEKSLGVTRAHFLEAAKQWHDKAREAENLATAEKGCAAPEAEVGICAESRRLG